MRNLFGKYGLMAFGLVAGAIAGYAYWRLVGCDSGTCAITSDPFNSTLYGGVMGGLLLSTFRKDKKEKA